MGLNKQEKVFPIGSNVPAYLKDFELFEDYVRVKFVATSNNSTLHGYFNNPRSRKEGRQVVLCLEHLVKTYLPKEELSEFLSEPRDGFHSFALMVKEKLEEYDYQDTPIEVKTTSHNGRVYLPKFPPFMKLPDDDSVELYYNAWEINNEKNTLNNGS